MFPSWRLKIWDARRAFKAGRWDEASALLRRESVRDFLPAKKLSAEVASQLTERAQQRIVAGESSAGWQDLKLAAQLGGSDEQLSLVRNAYAERCLQRIRHYLACGETAMASEQIDELQRRHLGGQERKAWKLIIGLIARARFLAEHGKLRAAAENLQRAKLLLPDPGDSLADELAERRESLLKDAEQVSQLNNDLYAAITDEDWHKVLSLAEQLLELAPEHEAAKQGQRLAWNSIGLEATHVFHRKPYVRGFARRPAEPVSTRNGTGAREETMTLDRTPGKRLVSWIDGVGGYMICLEEEVVIGQPAPGANADIPILADLSRRHASIRREGESYVLTPIHTASINGREVTGPVVLSDNSEIQLGRSVRLRFRKPHALSGTAVLTVESNHKTEPAVDGIVLMADSCILGAESHSHIRSRNWEKNLVLFRRGEDLHFRSAASVEIDGQMADKDAPLPANCRLEAENLALSFESL